MFSINDSIIGQKIVVDFLEADDDHLIFRRFKRLHLINLYEKHNRLLELDEEAAAVQRDADPKTRDKDAYEEPDDKEAYVSALYANIDQALKDFGQNSTPLKPYRKAADLCRCRMDTL